MVAIVHVEHVIVACKRALYEFFFSARCNIYISRLCRDASPSVCDGSALVHYS